MTITVAAKRMASKNCSVKKNLVEVETLGSTNLLGQDLHRDRDDLGQHVDEHEDYQLGDGEDELWEKFESWNPWLGGVEEDVSVFAPTLKIGRKLSMIEQSIEYY